MSIINVVGGGAALQDAINVAVHHDEILVDDGIYSPITFSGRNIVVTIKSLNGPDNCIIDGGTYYDEETNSWIGTKGIGGYSYNNQVIIGFTIRNCGSYSEDTTSYGSIKDVKLVNCKIHNNIATYGGGCYNCYLDHCEVYNNRAAKGGGCYIGEIYFSKIHDNNADLTDTSEGGGTMWGNIYYSEIYNNYQYSTNGNYAGGGMSRGSAYFSFVHDNRTEVSWYRECVESNAYSCLFLGPSQFSIVYSSTIISDTRFCIYYGGGKRIHRNNIYVFTGTNGSPFAGHNSTDRKNYEYCLVYPYQSNVLDNPGMLNGIDPMLDENYKPTKDSPVIGAANPEYIMTDWDLARRRWNKENPSIGCYEYKLNNFNLPNSLYPMTRTC